MRRLAAALLVLAVALWLVPGGAPPPSHGQGVDVYINITGGGGKKLNIAIPDFALVAGADPGGLAHMLAALCHPSGLRRGKNS